MSEHEHMHPPQQPDRISWKWVTGVTIATITLTVVLSVIAAYTVYAYRDAYGGTTAPRGREPGPPGLPANTELEYHLFVEEEALGEGQRVQVDERARLESWGWANREAGRVRVPIDEAIDMVAQEQR